MATFTIVHALGNPFEMSNHIARRNSDSEESPSSFTPVNGRGEHPHLNGQHDDTSPSDISPTCEPYTGPSSANNSPTNSPHTREKNDRSTLSGGNGISNRGTSPPHESVEQAHKRKRSLSMAIHYMRDTIIVHQNVNISTWQKAHCRLLVTQSVTPTRSMHPSLMVAIMQATVTATRGRVLDSIASSIMLVP
jgi:hypothetical protein